ncbi:hypothetical protein WDM22_28680 [Bradyrhizobium septentrionale]|uniref:Uncharacterized protein n=1 Tax=Bradyrhizobium septentrionale TaxID=1404411 RepID=A0ABZ2P8J3_9BRAD
MKLADPPLNVPVPNRVAPSKNDTVPVGAPDVGDAGATVAVNVTATPAVPGFADDDNVVLVASWLTVWGTLKTELPLKLVSPP